MAARAVAAAVCLLLLASACTDTGEPAAEASPGQPPSSRSASEGTEPTESPTPSPLPRRTRRPRQQPPDLSPAQQARLDARLRDASWDNDLARARRLVRRGADVNAKDDNQESAYLIATSEGYLRLLELTFAHGARIDAKDRFNGTGLIRAAERGHWQIVGPLLQRGIDADHVNILGWTALHEAVILGDGSRRYRDTVRALVAGGVDLTIPAVRDGLTARQHAESRGQPAVADLLRRAEAQQRVPRARAERRLLRAARTGDADAAALALRAGARLEARDGRRRTPLLLAVTGDHLPVARLLVTLGADPDALDSQHDTPWLVTGVTGSVPMADLLLTAHPDLTIENRFGGLSVIPASERGHVAYVRRVVRTRIDLDHVNDLGWTALLEAVVLGDGSRPYQRIVEILLEAGADPSIPDGDGVTALVHARDRGQTEVARILRRHS